MIWTISELIICEKNFYVNTVYGKVEPFDVYLDRV